MTVESILREKGQDVETIPADTTVTVAIHLLAAKGVGALVVTADGDRVDGVLSERDVLRGLARFGEASLGMPVGEIMTKPVPVCSRTDTVQHVMEMMTRIRQRHVVVLDDAGLAGIVSIGDVVKSRLDDLELEAGVLRDSYIANRWAAIR